jgi:hypothetical protein
VDKRGAAKKAFGNPNAFFDCPLSILHFTWTMFSDPLVSSTGHPAGASGMSDEGPPSFCRTSGRRFLYRIALCTIKAPNPKPSNSKQIPISNFSNRKSTQNSKPFCGKGLGSCNSSFQKFGDFEVSLPITLHYSYFHLHP